MTLTNFPNGIETGSVGLKTGGSGVTATPAVFCLRASFDPTSSSQVSLGTMPAGAVVLDVVSYGGATGGTTPTVDVGTSGDDDGFANELDADGVSSAVADGTTGALINTANSSATEVFGKVGASAATGGTTAVAVYFVIP